MDTVDPIRREAIYLHSLMAVASAGLGLICAALIYNNHLRTERKLQTEYQAFDNLYQNLSYAMTVDEVNDLLGPPSRRERAKKQVPRGTTVWIWTYQVYHRQYMVYFFADSLEEENLQWRAYDWREIDPYDQRSMMIEGFRWFGIFSIGFFILLVSAKLVWKRILTSRTRS